MTALSEAQLIEIADRFELLERHVERADMILAGHSEACRERAERADDLFKSNTKPSRGEALRSAAACAKMDAAHVEDVRMEVERKLQACSEDLAALLDQVRRLQ